MYKKLPFYQTEWTDNDDDIYQICSPNPLKGPGILFKRTRIALKGSFNVRQHLEGEHSQRIFEAKTLNGVPRKPAKDIKMS